MKKEIKICYIGGGSRAWARKLMADLALDEEISGSVYLYDIDYAAAKDNETIGNMFSKHESARSDWRYKAVQTIDEGLENSDVVVISVMPGTFKEMQSDVHAPEKLGVYQSVGDSVGFGGYLRAMRCTPIFRGFADKIRAICPHAFVINYTNPMTLCTRILTDRFPEMKIIGCCHEVFGTQKLLARLVSKVKNIPCPAREEIEVNVTGINHFTWLTKAVYHGEDLFPLFADFSKANEKEGFLTSEGAAHEYDLMYCKNMIKFEMFNRYGVIPAAGDRHLAEFFVGKWYLQSPEFARKNGFNLTPVSWRVEDLKNRLETSKKIVSGEMPPEIGKSDEEGVRQIKAVLGLGDLVTNVNIPNRGQISNYPLGAVVETNAELSGTGIRPLTADPLPPEIDAFIMKHVYHHEAFIRAANKCDANAVKYIISDDPQCAAVSFEQLNRLFDEMYNNTKDYLDFYWHK